MQIELEAAETGHGVRRPLPCDAVMIAENQAALSSI
jgi:hypothetical protein